jgi:hypothetical protein
MALANPTQEAFLCHFACVVTQVHHLHAVIQFHTSDCGYSPVTKCSYKVGMISVWQQQHVHTCTHTGALPEEALSQQRLLFGAIAHAARKIAYAHATANANARAAAAAAAVTDELAETEAEVCATV